MQTSPSIKNLAVALLKAQTQMGGAVKGSKNPFFKSNYADLPTVMEVVKGPLNEAGIVVLQPASHHEGKNFIETILIHAESGETVSSFTEVICSKANDPQAFGAAQTYARRFGLQSMVFIPSEDDDGNKASGRDTKTTRVEVPKTLPIPVTTEPSLSSASAASTPTALTQTNSLPLGSVQAQTVADVQPLKTSSFRKPRKAKTEEAPVTTGDQGWDS